MPRTQYLEKLKLQGRKAAYDLKHKLDQRAHRSTPQGQLVLKLQHKKQETVKRLRKPFIGVDGEGGGVDEHGRQLYRLLTVGDQSLFNNNNHLSTTECLRFLCDQGKTQRGEFVSFAFDYDVTMICRDLTEEHRALLKHPYKLDENHRSVPQYVGYGPYLIRYVKRKEFSVIDENSHHKIMITDVFTNFQCSFIKVLKDWQIGTPEELAIIEAGKASRATMDLMGEKEIEYNMMECRLLAEIMTEFDKVCRGCNIKPRTYQGPGLIAQKMMDKHNVPKNSQYSIPDQIKELAQAAYYGGRFETTAIGKCYDIWEYDINSAYPFAMLSLPCLLHSEWVRSKLDSDAFTSYSIANIRFTNHPLNTCAFPIRNKQGNIAWPVRGQGTYWGFELLASRSFLADCEVMEHWQIIKHCDCQPFSYVPEIYEERIKLGKSTKGYPLKLALNSQYGKLAQSIGSPKYANAIWAGMITAYVRAMLLRAALLADPENIVMFATDGIYSRIPIRELSQRPKVLGDWELKHHPEMFLVKPGIYFSTASRDRPKSRGIPITEVAKHENIFRQVLHDWLQTDLDAFFADKHRKKDIPTVPIPLKLFVGLNLAAHRNDSTLAGKWLESVKCESFDFETKRRYRRHDRETIYTRPIEPEGWPATIPYKNVIGGNLPGNAVDWGEDYAMLAAATADSPDDFQYAGVDPECR